MAPNLFGGVAPHGRSAEPHALAIRHVYTPRFTFTRQQAKREAMPQDARLASPGLPAANARDAKHQG